MSTGRLTVDPQVIFQASGGDLTWEGLLEQIKTQAAAEAADEGEMR